MSFYATIGQWMLRKDLYADALHFIGAYAVIFTAVSLSGHTWPWCAAMVAYAAFKEFFIDIRLEVAIPQTYTKGVRDFLGYMAGMGVALLMLHL